MEKIEVIKNFRKIFEKNIPLKYWYQREILRKILDKIEADLIEEELKNDSKKEIKE
jgi:hypothetical protein